MRSTLRSCFIVIKSYNARQHKKDIVLRKLLAKMGTSLHKLYRDLYTPTNRARCTPCTRYKQYLAIVLQILELPKWVLYYNFSQKLGKTYLKGVSYIFNSFCSIFCYTDAFRYNMLRSHSAANVCQFCGPQYRFAF